ncbi:MAG: TIGR03905 family TSCPD domain-containing protein [Eubacteriales bacterium]|nr:TIGR03905 family TSCPD domain-containing protein [Eubacteriales bacterium]
MKYDFSPKGVCARKLEFELDGDIVKNVRFKGGCNGNLKALAALTEGMTVDQVCERLKGITCGLKNTSCSDQLAQALAKAQEIEKKKASECDSQAGA